MEELELTEIIKIVKKRKLTLIFCILASVGITASFLSTMVPFYQATAKVLIESPPSKKISIEDILVQNADNDEYLNTQYSLFRSRTLIKSLIQELHLESSNEFTDTSPFNMFNPLKVWINSILAKTWISQEGKPEEITTDPYSPLIDIFLERLEVYPEKKSKIVNIHFQGISPVLVAEITNTLVVLFIRDHIDYQKTLEANTEKWLALKGDEMNKQGKNYFSEIQDFKKKQNLFELDGKRDFADQQYSETLAEIAKVRTNISKLNSLILQMRRLKLSPQKMFYSIPESLKDGTITKLRDSYVEEKIKFDNLSKTLKRSHPDLISISIKIEAIKARFSGEMERFLKSLEADFRALLKQEGDLNLLQKKQKEKLLSLDNKTVQLKQMIGEADSHKKLLEQMVTRGKELEIFSSYYFPPIRVVDRAEVPRKPVKPRIGIALALALSVGVFGGLVLVFFRESLDSSLKTEDDIGRKLPYLLLGSLGWYGKNGISKSSKNAIKLKEEFQNLRTRFLPLISENPNKVFIVTSTFPGEGKSTVTSHLAISLGEVGKKVAIIDADFENPKIHANFGVEQTPGIIDILSKSNGKRPIPIKTKHSGVWVIPAGEPSSSPDVLLSTSLPLLLDRLRKVFDVILIKTAPVLSGSHTRIIEKCCDGILFVMASGMSDKILIQKMISQLTSTPIEIKNRRFLNRREDKIPELPGETPSNQKKFRIILTKVKDKKNEEIFGYERYKNKIYKINPLRPILRPRLKEMNHRFKNPF